MRLVLSIVSFALAVVFLGAGIAQRTVLLPPASINASVQATTDNLYTVVDSNVLTAHAGQLTITASGTDTTVVAVGRTDDVMAWIGQAPYAEVNATGGKTAVTQITPDADPTSTVPVTGTPAGSDLWLAEATGTDSAALTVDVPSGYSAIIASDGQSAAPADLSFSWAVSTSTPWAGPFLVLGAILVIVGGVLLYLNWRDQHGRGPRRKGPGSPEQTAPQRRAIASSKAPKRKELGPVKGRRSLGRTSRALAIPLVALSAVALSGCSSEYWPSAADGAAATVTATPESADGGTSLQPAVTEPQMARVLGEISAFAAGADSALNTSVLDQRFAGPALAARTANYQIRAKKSDYAAPAAIPAQPITITLPQQVDNSWPRLVMTVSQNDQDSSLPPVALVMLQNSPRDNYHVYYAITLVPNAQSPQLAPATIGAPRIPADSKLLMVQPNQLANEYGDVLTNDVASAYAALFSTDGDTLMQQLGKAGQDTIRSQLPSNSAISFSAAAGTGPALALATVDSGAVVAVQVDQLRKITPTDGGTVGFADGSGSAALSGFTSKSSRGVQSTSGLQMLFYVPAVGSTDQVRVLGWTESLIAASEIPG